MSTEPQLSRLIFAGVAGPDLSVEEIAALGELQPGGVTLFSRNLRSLQQVHDLICGLRECARQPLVVAIDVEGGPVNRLTAVDPRLGALPAARVQATWGPGRLVRIWEHVGRLLASVGIDLDFAPVVDLAGGTANNGLAERSFAADPRAVLSAARAVLEGLEQADRAGCLKHFPGLGGTAVDTHRALATSPHDVDQLWEQHLLPFRALADRAPAVMMAHAAYPAIEADRPASLCPTIVTGWLRERLGYDGVVFSDDLAMGALDGCGSAGERARAVLAAGADVALFCHDLDQPRRARDAVAGAVQRGVLDVAAITRSAARVETLIREPAASVDPQLALETLLDEIQAR